MLLVVSRTRTSFDIYSRAAAVVVVATLIIIEWEDRKSNREAEEDPEWDYSTYPFVGQETRVRRTSRISI